MAVETEARINTGTIRDAGLIKEVMPGRRGTGDAFLENSSVSDMTARMHGSEEDGTIVYWGKIIVKPDGTRFQHVKRLKFVVIENPPSINPN